MDAAQISAVILDLDGTLLDTEKATSGILKEFLARYGKQLDNEKEDKRLGMMHKESAAAIVVDYELPLTADEYSEAIMPMYRQRWPHAKALPGASRLISHLHKHGVPLSLASNSIKKHIEMKISYQQGWKDSFSVIIGGDEVKNGKPSPDMFLEAAKRMGVDATCCLVIEDSLVGVRAAKAAGMKVVAVPSVQTQVDRYSIANSVLHSLLEFQPELWGLPAFEDWVQNALVIEPMFARGLLCKATAQEASTLLDILATDEGSRASLPDQLWGLYCGWAKLGIHGVFKMVVSISWDVSSGAAKRIIQPCLIGESLSNIDGEQLHLLIVGYIRKMNSEVSAATTFGISEEDKYIAGAALDLPMFVYHKNNIPALDLPMFVYHKNNILLTEETYGEVVGCSELEVDQ